MFGYVTLLTTVVIFLLTPYSGMMIDRFSRKAIMIYGEAVVFLIAAFFSAVGLVGIEYNVWHLVFLYASGVFYYFLFYPALFALNQELFERSQYKQINGIFEIQGQLATVIAGGAASILIGKVDLQWILVLDAMYVYRCYLLFMENSVPSPIIRHF